MIDQEVKKQLIIKCEALVEDRIANAEAAMSNAQDSANEEARSTAGDKYDTARAMSQLDRDMFARQLAEAVQLRKALQRINGDDVLEEVELGALVETTMGTFFIAVSLGQIELGDKMYNVISAMTPLAQVMLSKGKGDPFTFNKKNAVIEAIV